MGQGASRAAGGVEEQWASADSALPDGRPAGRVRISPGAEQVLKARMAQASVLKKQVEGEIGLPYCLFRSLSCLAC